MAKKRLKPERAGLPYQRLVAEIAAAFDPEADIEVGKWVQGPDGRLDLDVSIRWAEGDKQFLAVIECKDYSEKTTGRVGRPIVDALDSKRIDLNADYAFICSNSGFSEDAISKGSRKGIGLLSVLKAGDGRVKVVVSQEVYVRHVDVSGPYEQHYETVKRPGGSNFDGVSNVEPDELRFEGKFVGSWLREQVLRYLIETIGSGQEPCPTTLFFRPVNPIEVAFREWTVFLDGLGLTVYPRTHWTRQVVQVDSTNAIHDYVRGMTSLAPGSQSIILRDVDFDAGEPIDLPSGRDSYSVEVAGDPVDMTIAVIDGLGSSADQPAADLDNAVAFPDRVPQS